MSLPSFTGDFRHLLTPTNLQGVFDHSEEFILLKVPRLNFKGSGDARAREWFQSCLFTLIKEASEEIEGGNVGDAFPLIAPSSLRVTLDSTKKVKGVRDEYHVRATTTRDYPKTLTGGRKGFYSSTNGGCSGHHFTSRGTSTYLPTSWWAKRGASTSFPTSGRDKDSGGL